MRQEKLSDKTPQLREYFADLSHELAGLVYSKQESVSIHLLPEPLIAALLHWPENEPIVVITSLHGGDFQRLAQLAERLGQKFNPQKEIFAISDQLSEQELLGDIATSQSIAYHNLLSEKSALYLISTQSTQNNVVSPIDYKKLSLSLSAREKRPLSIIAEALTRAGYKRHRTTLEDGSFLIRGEQLRLKHPAQNEIITVTFSGDIVERILVSQNQRQQEQQRINILPVAFPEPATNASKLFEDIHVFQSSTSNPLGKKTTFYNAPSSLLKLPEQINQDLEKLTAHLLPTQATTLRPVSYEEALELIGQLEAGKPAVHTDHGIGIFEGLQTRQIESNPREYLVMRYAEGDTLSVPVEYAYKVTPYVGSTSPTIHRLHGAAWQKTKKKAQHDAALFAKELLKIANARTAADRTSYTFSEGVEQELNETFPHELTDDQVKTWQEVKSDMQKPQPMDRLVVGDVGFGKTEIAYRAARHAIAGGRQVAVLAPTTLLVQQHFDVFQKRLSQAAGTVHLLSRFTSTKQQKATREAITSGQASIVVGTHALLGKSLNWKNLGLVVIDEEQRFGVKQKEHFKKIRSQIDVLSLSATPIPRTLSMALSGLRTLSLISTPPTERKEVKTQIGRLTDEKLKAAIGKELDRDGQAYVVAPKIRQLGKIHHNIKTLFPSASIAVAHGRLPDNELAKIIHRFDSGEIDILISSSIVEHGLDLPNANTMIVMHAPHFGLSELYQLRGRIGRRAKQGYAHFFYTQENLTSVQRQRLAALTEASRLGSGWELARRDLEIRGAGNLIGAEQSGSADAVGVQLYLDMVHGAAEETIQEPQTEAEIALPIPSLLPATYIPDTTERTRWYVRLSRAKDVAALEKLQTRLEKTFGSLPPEVQNLLLSIRLAKIAGKRGITKISISVISPPDEDPYLRITIEAQNPLSVLEKITSLGNWRAKASTLTLDIDKISPSWIKKLTSTLQ